jgi:hypothetical protein
MVIALHRWRAAGFHIIGTGRAGGGEQRQRHYCGQQDTWCFHARNPQLVESYHSLIQPCKVQ